MIKITQGDIKDLTGATGVDVSHALRHLPPVEKSGRWQYYDAAAALECMEAFYRGRLANARAVTDGLEAKIARCKDARRQLAKAQAAPMGNEGTRT